MTPSKLLFLWLLCGACHESLTPGTDVELDAGTESPPAFRVQASTFPIEVLGICVQPMELCAETEVSVELPDSLPAGDLWQLELTLHNLVAKDSAEVVINNVTTIPMADAASPFLTRHGGVVHGTLDLPVDAVKPGINKLVFRYSRMIDGVSGYRIIDLALRNAEIVARPTLAIDEPSSWTSPSDQSADIEQGRSFFREVSRDGGPACGTCHTDTGSDLEYFGFSNDAIEKRAQLHLFSETDAKKIAAYLRHEQTERLGKIFEPPFQPGPTNQGAIGVGYLGQVSDEAFGMSAFGPTGLPNDIPWDWANGVDPFYLPSPVQLPSWFRWLPRELKQDWLDAQTDVGGGQLSVEEAWKSLQTEPSHEHAVTLMDTAFAVGRRLVVEKGDYQGRVQLLRFAATKLWEWSRQNGFDGADHGLPDSVVNLAPAYPYEVGFAFFEQARDGVDADQAWAQAIEWWWVQLVMNSGRGNILGQRPMEYGDVLTAAEAAGLGSNALVFLHLIGSWEESRGALAQQTGSEKGPVRLLAVPLRYAAAPTATSLWKRFFAHQSEWLAADQQLSEQYHVILQNTWAESCGKLSGSQRAEIRSLAVDTVSDLVACP